MSRFIQAIWDHHQSRFCWEVEEIKVIVAQGLEDDTETTINFASTLGQVSRPKRRLADDDYYWLPKRFNENTPEFRSKTLAPYFSQACREAGFGISMKGWNKRHDLVIFHCFRSRKHQPQRHADPKRRKNGYKIKRPKADEEPCRFRFNVNWHPTHGRWCVLKKQRGCAKHNGHLKDGDENRPVVDERNVGDPKNALDYCLPILTAATKNIKTKQQLQRFTAALREAHMDVLVLAPKEGGDAEPLADTATAGEQETNEEQSVDADPEEQTADDVEVEAIEESESDPPSEPETKGANSSPEDGGSATKRRRFGSLPVGRVEAL